MYALLSGANLSQYEAQFSALGASEPSDLADMEDAELAAMGIKGLDIKRLRRKVEDQALGAGMTIPDYSVDAMMHVRVY